MKYNIFTITVFSFLMLLTACQTPEDLKPSESRLGLNSIKASFLKPNGTTEGEFTGKIKEGSDEIIIEVPYFYPENSDNQVVGVMLKKMKVVANLDDNVTISPALTFMDLRTDNFIMVKDQLGEIKKYNVKALIVKSKAAVIEEFKIPSLGLTGVINESTKTIALIVPGNIGGGLAEMRVAPHATLTPDPRVTALNYDKEQEIEVTAHDGITKVKYIVRKEVPNKLPYGIRAGSGKQIFAKKLKSDLGITVDNMTGGIAISGDYLVLNTRGQNSVYINAKTGELAGSIDLGAIKGSVTNFYNTSDDAGNILVTNLTMNAGNIFNVYKIASVTGSPETYISWDAGGLALGRKLSVKGSIQSNAILTAPILVSKGTEKRFARWQVTAGTLVSQTPTIVSVTDINGWTTNCDIVYTSATDINSDYFIASYSENRFAWINGVTNTSRKKLDAISGNYIPNAVDYAEFNKAKYTILNWVNSFSWGSADAVWLLDVSSDQDFSGNLETKTCKSVVWECERNVWGGKSITPPVINANQTGDVAIKVSDDGYFLYLYFMFTNGYVVGYQFDCIDM